MGSALYEKIPIIPGWSFACRVFRPPRFTTPWHFHPEVELTLILTGRGTRYVGDNIARFEDGDLALLGPNLPHYWWKDDGDARRVHSIVVQFDRNFLGEGFLGRPEAAPISRLIARASRGLGFSGATRAWAAERLAAMPRLEPWPALLSLLEILGRLAGATGAVPLCSAGYSPAPAGDSGRRMTAACNYVHEHYSDAIRQPEAARRTGLSPAAFSRYFRRHMGKTFEGYVNEVRVGHVCRLLLEGDMSVGQAAFESGFNNLANFNRRFRAVTGDTPSQFKAKHARVP